MSDEYRLTDDQLSKLGREGWELINFLQTQAGGFLYIFKRPQ